MVIERDGIAVTLQVTAGGEPELTVRRGGKALKNVPKSHGKDPGFAALKARVKELRGQASRVKGVLEASMVRGDTFTGSEITELLQPPDPRAELRKLRVHRGGGAGYPAPDGHGGLQLMAPGAQVTSAAPTDEVRLAHAEDLFSRGIGTNGRQTASPLAAPSPSSKSSASSTP